MDIRAAGPGSVAGPNRPPGGLTPPPVADTHVLGRRPLRLTLLAPDTVDAILDGRQPEGMTLPRLMEGVGVEWEEQCVRRSFLERSVRGYLDILGTSAERCG